MKIKATEVDAYAEWKGKNTDDYGRGIFKFAERWAELMEVEIEKGAEVKDIAGKLCSVADTEGITGYMYNSGVAILANCWEYGEELRKWHNGDYKGEGTVNTAVLNVNK